MLIDIDPVIFSLGPLQIRWYGLMYVIGFLVGVRILAKLAREGFIHIPEEKSDQAMTYLLVGMFIFARLFYVLIYGRDQAESFIDIIAVWRGGLSFHGAAIGYIVATYLFARKNKIPFNMAMDAIVLCVPQGLFFGRLGNFMNMELYGRETDSFFGMVFASDPLRLVRHPSQIYQAIGEGLILGLILWTAKRKKYVSKYGQIGALFLVSYGIIRYSIEFFRQPDSQLGLYLGGTTSMGQILCALMVFYGLFHFYYIHRHGKLITYTVVKSDEDKNSSVKKPKKFKGNKKRN